MKKFLNEFKEFAMRGNVVDLAVGVIIGGAFQKIVTSLVGDIFSPLLGLFGGIDFKNMKWIIKEAVMEGSEVVKPEVAIGYGAFVTEIINFVIMAFIVFMLVKTLAKLANVTKKKEEAVEEPTTKKCPYCCSEISIDAKRCPHCTSEL